MNFGQLFEYLQGKEKAQQSLTMNNPNSSRGFSSDQHQRTPDRYDGFKQLRFGQSTSNSQSTNNSPQQQNYQRYFTSSSKQSPNYHSNNSPHQSQNRNYHHSQSNTTYSQNQHIPASPSNSQNQSQTPINSQQTPTNS